MTRVMLKASDESWQSSTRFESSVCCIVSAFAADVAPAVPDFALLK